MNEVMLPHGTFKEGTAGHSDDSGVICSYMPTKDKKESVAQGGSPLVSGQDLPLVIGTITSHTRFALCKASVSPHSPTGVVILESWSTSHGGWKTTLFVAT